MRRRAAVYPSCFGKLRLADIARIARRLGLEVIDAYKAGMHCYNEIGVYGTTAQIQALRLACEENGNNLKPRSFRSICGVRLDLPRDRWIVAPSDHRDHCQCWQLDGSYCDCDYDPSL